MRIIDLEELKRLASNARGYINFVYLHWTAGHYNQLFDDYHVLIDDKGRIFIPDDNLKVKRSHTWQRNSHSLGVALCCCYGAQANNGYNCNFGDEPPTQAQIEAISAVVAVLCKYAGIPVVNVLTHCEAAKEDGYGPYSGDPETRWDLWYLPDYDGEMKPGGQVLRGKVRWYLSQV